MSKNKTTSIPAKQKSSSFTPSSTLSPPSPDKTPLIPKIPSQTQPQAQLQSKSPSPHSSVHKETSSSSTSTFSSHSSSSSSSLNLSKGVEFGIDSDSDDDEGSSYNYPSSNSNNNNDNDSTTGSNPNSLLSLAPSSSSPSPSPAHGEGQPLTPFGILIVASFITLWVTQSEYVQTLTTGDENNEPYNKPAFICYLNHSILVFYFPLVFVLAYLNKGHTPAEHIRLWLGAYTARKASWVYAGIALLYFVCIWAWVYGLEYITVSFSNSIYQLQCLFAVFFSYHLLNETFINNKKYGVVICFLGIAMVVLPPVISSDNVNVNPMFGGGLTLFSAVTWGLYEVVYKIAVTHKNVAIIGDAEMEHSKLDSSIETMTTISFLGLGTLLFVPPFLLLLHVTNIEPFELPHDTADVIKLTLNASISFTFDFLFALSIHLTSPVLVSISSALVIPLSFAADYVLHGREVYYVSVCGSVVVVFGLGVLNSEGFWRAVKRGLCFWRREEESKVTKGMYSKV